MTSDIRQRTIIVLAFAAVIAVTWALAMRASGFGTPIALRSLWIVAMSTLIGGLPALWITHRAPWPGRLTLPFLAIQLAACTALALIWVIASGLLWRWAYEFDLLGSILDEGTAGFRTLSGFWLYIGLLSTLYFRDIQHRWRASMEAANEARLMAAQARIDALRSHLNPHFLFNSLHAINALMHVDLERAEVALEALSSLLRRSLEDHRDLIPLCEELQIAKQYLSIHQLRHGDRIRLSEHISPELLDRPIPMFGLQILVENAIEHGQSSTGEWDIAIRVRGAASDDQPEGIVVTVEDTGPGTDPERLLRPEHAVHGLLERARLLLGQACQIRAGRADGVFSVRFFLPQKLPAQPAAILEGTA